MTNAPASLFSTAAILLAIGSGAAHAASPFKSLSGSWSGTGRAMFEGGRSEAMRCAAYYTAPSSTQLGLAIRCASQGNKIDMRGHLTYSGGQVNGSWEERTFNAGGSAHGTASSNSVALSFSGSISGGMSVRLSGGTQTVSVRSQGTALRGFTISLSRR